MSRIFGYMRVAARKEIPSLKKALRKAGAGCLFIDIESEGGKNQPDFFYQMFTEATEGDTILVVKFEQLACYYASIDEMLDIFCSAGIRFRSLEVPVVENITIFDRYDQIRQKFAGLWENLSVY